MDTTTALFKALKRMEDCGLTIPEFPQKLGKWSLVEIVDELHATYVDKKGIEEKVFVSEDSVNEYAKEYAIHDPEYRFCLHVSKWHSDAVKAVYEIELSQRNRINQKMYSDLENGSNYLHENCSGYYD